MYTLLSVLIFTGYCIGQPGTPLPKDRIGNPATIKGGQPKLIKTQGSDQYQNVHCGLQDKAGDLWFGTTGEGVYRYDGKSFTQFTAKNGLNSNTVWCVAEDKAGNIWIGTNAGVCLYNGKTITRITIAATKSSPLFFTSTADRNPPTKNEVFSIMQDKKGTLWFGTSEGVYCYNGKIFTRFLDNYNIINKDTLGLKSVQCMLEDKNGNIWFGSEPMAFEGICRYDGKSLIHFKPNGEGWIRAIAEDKKGDIRFTSRHNGLYRYDGKAFSAISSPREMVLGSLMSTAEDKAGNIWFASDYGNDIQDMIGGVWRFDGKSFIKFTTKDGLSNNSACCIVEDRAGNIWVGTRNNGLYRYDGKAFFKFSE